MSETFETDSADIKFVIVTDLNGRQERVAYVPASLCRKFEGNFNKVCGDYARIEVARRDAEAEVARLRTQLESQIEETQIAASGAAEARAKVAELNNYLDAKHYKTCNAELRAEVARLRDALARIATTHPHLVEESK